MNPQISQILLTFKNEKDLNKNVLDFFSPSLIKLNNISERINNPEVDFELKRNFEQIINKDLLRTLEIYTKLPIETRNTDIINPYENKKQTALDVLVQSLSMVAAKINKLWDDLLDEDKTKLIVKRVSLEYSSADNGSLLASEFEKEKVDYSPDVKKEIKRLMQKAEGSWQNGFNSVVVEQISKKTESEEENTEEGLTPFNAILLFTVLSSFIIFCYNLLS